MIDKPETQLRFAIVGCGLIGRKRLNSLNPGQLAVACDVAIERAEALTTLAGHGRATADFVDAVTDPAVDAVVVATLNNLLAPIARKAITAGKHVLVEKPMALDPYGADRMMNAARRYKRVLMTAQVLRFFPEYMALHQAISGGQLGRFRFATFRRRCAAPAWGGWLQDPEKSGGGVFDLLIHDVDMCLLLFGKPKAVCASGYSDAALGIDCMDAQLFYDDGLAQITGGWHNAGEFPFSMEYCVTLDGGTVEYSSLGRPPTLFGAKGGSQLLELKPSDGYAAEIDYFAGCCDNAQFPDRCPPADSADAVKLMRLMLESRQRNGAKMICTL